MEDPFLLIKFKVAILLVKKIVIFSICQAKLTSHNYDNKGDGMYLILDNNKMVHF